MQMIGLFIVFVSAMPCQERDWKSENFAGPVPDEIWMSNEGQIQLVNILGSRRWRHTDRITSVAFSPDGRHALSGSWDNTLKLWDTETGKELAAWKGQTGWVRE